MPDVWLTISMSCMTTLHLRTSSCSFFASVVNFSSVLGSGAAEIYSPNNVQLLQWVVKTYCTCYRCSSSSAAPCQGPYTASRPLSSPLLFPLPCPLNAKMVRKSVTSDSFKSAAFNHHHFFNEKLSYIISRQELPKRKMDWEASKDEKSCSIEFPAVWEHTKNETYLPLLFSLQQVLQQVPLTLSLLSKLLNFACTSIPINLIK